MSTLISSKVPITNHSRIPANVLLGNQWVYWAYLQGMGEVLVLLIEMW